MRDDLAVDDRASAELQRFDQRRLVPDLSAWVERWRAGGLAAAARLGEPARLDYGLTPAEYVDLFPAPGARGVHLHFHGGAWKALGSNDSWWLAGPWHDAGWHFATVNFGLVPEIGLGLQVRQCRTALRLLPELLQRAGQAPVERVVVSGHSSGAHLAAMVALTDDEEAPGAAPAVQAAVLASGLYDLRPVRLSARNDYLGLDQAAADSLSPMRRLAARLPSVTVLWSENELPEFQRQSADLVAALRTRGAAVTERRSGAATHFDTWDEILPGLLG